jgi:hypothetical protein
MSREGVPLVVIQRQLGHADLGITSAYLRGIDNTEIIDIVHQRPAPMVPASSRAWAARLTVQPARPTRGRGLPRPQLAVEYSVQSPAGNEAIAFRVKRPRERAPPGQSSVAEAIVCGVLESPRSTRAAHR